MSLLIPHHLLITMHKHALDTFPNECCGFFFGEEAGKDRFITAVKATANSKPGDQRRRFEIHPKDYMTAEREALVSDTLLLGIYHSHPNHPATPSEHDLKQAVPFFSYLIISLSEIEILDTTSWQLQKENFIKEKIIIQNEVNSIN